MSESVPFEGSLWKPLDDLVRSQILTRIAEGARMDDLYKEFDGDQVEAFFTVPDHVEKIDPTPGQRIEDAA